MTASYEVRVYRDDGWWMISVPEIDALSNARGLAEVEATARSLIAISTDAEPDEFDIAVTRFSIRRSLRS